MQSSRIMIDGYNLALEEGTGISTYSRNLSYTLKELGAQVDVLYGTPRSPRNDLMREIAFFDPNVGKPTWWDRMMYEVQMMASVPAIRATAMHVPMSDVVIKEAYKSRLPRADDFWNVPNVFARSYKLFDTFNWFLTVAMPSRPQIAHWTYPLPLKIAGAQNIYTIHDLVPLRLPYTTLDVKRRYYKLMKALASRAHHIVTVSETSKRDIVNILGIPEERVTNTYQAVDIPAKYANKPTDIVKQEVEGTFNLNYKGYMLFFGAIEPKKNVARLIEAYLGSGVDIPLVIVGKLGWKSEQELKLLNADVINYLEQVDNLMMTRKRIYRIEYASFPLLVSLIRGAKAVMFPSLYEGFGLPALEAMQLGTPVLSSTGGSMPEVCQDAALLVDPYDVRAIAEGIRALDSNAALREDLSQKGRLRAAAFSTDAYAARLDNMYKELEARRRSIVLRHRAA
ncbi:glycosyl transferase family 1 [Caballeronia novacaledonica]|uniref:Glycosyl transferase family 1 n=2 Tax=Caballeronia novacaledonica TaxID=1544861 RepID=A0A2U3I657_9BURK|nr:glycosyl transferase family 1 [Caballeronia novacaledonica]